MGIIQAYLPAMDLYRGLLDTTWGLRPFQVSVKVTTWPGGLLPGAPGVTPTFTVVPLLCNGGKVYARHISCRQVIASGGLYEEADWNLGPLTPPYVNAQQQPAGVNPAVFDPIVSAVGSGVQVLFNMQGPGMADVVNGDWFRLVSTETWRATRYHLIIRKTGETGV